MATVVKASAMPKKPAPAAIHAAVKAAPAKPVVKAVVKAPVKNLATAPTTVTTVTIHPIMLIGAGLLAFLFLSRK